MYVLFIGSCSSVGGVAKKNLRSQEQMRFCSALCFVSTGCNFFFLYFLQSSFPSSLSFYIYIGSKFSLCGATAAKQQTPADGLRSGETQRSTSETPHGFLSLNHEVRTSTPVCFPPCDWRGKLLFHYDLVPPSGRDPGVLLGKKSHACVCVFWEGGVSQP